MPSDPEVRLKGLGAAGRSRLVVRFRSVDTLLGVYHQVRETGAFSLAVDVEQPGTAQLWVLFRSRERGEEFPATVVTWSRGVAVLQPNLEISDFKELTGAILTQLSEEGSVHVDTDEHSLVAESGIVRAIPDGDEPETAPEPVDDHAAGANESNQSGTEAVVPAEAENPDEKATAQYQVTPSGPERKAGRSDFHRRPTLPADAQSTPTDERDAEPAPGGPAFVRSDQSTASYPAASLERREADEGSAPAPPNRSFRDAPRIDTGLHLVVPPLVAAEAYVFLEELKLEAPPLIEGLSSGRGALSELESFELPLGQVVFIVASERSDRRWYLVFQNGACVTGYLMPPSGIASLPALLARQGLLTTDVAQEVYLAGTSTGVPIEAALLDQAALDADMLRKVVRAKVKLLRSMVAAEPSVTYALYVLQDRIALPFAVSDETVEFERLYADLSGRRLADLEALLRPFLSHQPVLSGRPDILCQTLGFDPSTERFIHRCLTGEHSVQQIPTLTSLPRVESAALMLALHEVGLLEFREPRQPAVDRGRLQAIAEQHERIGMANDFEFLGLHWTAMPQEIERAISRLRRRLAPEVTASLGEQARRQAEAILTEVERISDGLSTLERRRAYRGQVLDSFAVGQAAELLLSNFDMALYRGDEGEMRRILERLRELDPAAALRARERVSEYEARTTPRRSKPDDDDTR